MKERKVLLKDRWTSILVSQEPYLENTHFKSNHKVYFVGDFILKKGSYYWYYDLGSMPLELYNDNLAELSQIQGQELSDRLITEILFAQKLSDLEIMILGGMTNDK